ncbi:hypothetical protein AG1IA_08745 [Rhizoctonia solani AG-1 IA]|uniref:Uncharacterized protein n=1 Tax=Thanatephorus cucumeris (strain AG1-IA) TaxID=983506 RepID=L8WH29_THACA|nr:hypothetical protein AG1IA_08745 [Rhizoctonia solani AG-1 IA]
MTPISNVPLHSKLNLVKITPMNTGRVATPISKFVILTCLISCWLDPLSFATCIWQSYVYAKTSPILIKSNPPLET